MEGEHPWSSAALPSSGPSADGGHRGSLAVVPSDPAPFCISRHRGSESRWGRIKPSLLVFIKPTPYIYPSPMSLYVQLTCGVRGGRERPREASDLRLQE